MKTLKEWAKKDNAVMKLLKISEMRHVIAHTTKGDLCLMLPFNGSYLDYRFVLDAVPCEDKLNKELMSLFNGTLFTF